MTWGVLDGYLSKLVQVDGGISASSNDNSLEPTLIDLTEHNDTGELGLGIVRNGRVEDEDS